MKKNGFTLIELSIVLIIIGLIIGGVMKGRDLINSAEQKKIYNTWIKEWQLVANSYQDRTGSLLGDGTTNGGTASTENGQLDNVHLYDATTVQDALKAIGLDVPTSNVPGTNGGAYSIKGKYATSQARAYLYWLGSTIDGAKNRLYITGVPTDVAIAFDKMTDGKVDASSGSFRKYNDAAVSGGIGGWPDAETTTTVNVSLEL